MKIAYVVLSHRDWPQVVKLVSTITALDRTAFVIVSHDSADMEGTAALRARPEINLLSSAGGRGGFTGILRWNEAIAALRRYAPVDYVLLISGQDYLIANPERIKTELESSGDGYLEHFRVLDPSESPWPTREGRTRYYYSWREIRRLSENVARRLRALHGINRIQPLLRLNVAYGSLRLGIRASGPPAPYVVYGGSQWNALSWRAAEHVAETIETRADVVSWASRSLVSEECFFQTVVLNESKFSVVHDSKRYYNFRNALFGHPKTLGIEDFEAITVSNSWFARKIDWTSSRRLIDEIDRKILKI